MEHTEVNQLNEVKILLKTGQISYDEARNKATPILSKLNSRGEKIAKEFGRRYSPVTFTGFMR